MDNSQQHKPPVATQTIIFGLIIFTILSTYLVVSLGDFTPRIINKAIAGTAFILIGLSFVISSMNYFWHVGVEQIMYRRTLGLTGGSFAIVHAIASLFLISEISPAFHQNPTTISIIAFIFGVVALAIYIDMILISNVAAAKTLGGLLWKKVLHAGYIAYLLTMVHFLLKGFSEWKAWYISAKNPFIPFDLLLFLFGLSVVVMRIGMTLSMRKKKQVTSVNA